MVKLAGSKTSTSRSHGSKRNQLKQPYDDLLGNPYITKITDISLSGGRKDRSRSLSSATTAQNGARRYREEVPLPIMVPWQSQGVSFSLHKESAEEVIEDKVEVESMGNQYETDAESMGIYSSDCEDSEVSEVSDSTIGTSVASSLGASRNSSIAPSIVSSLASSAFFQALLESTGAMVSKEAVPEQARDENADLDKELGPYLEGVKEEDEEEEEEEHQKDVEGNDMPNPADTSAGKKLLTLFTSPINEIMGNQHESERSSANPPWFASQNANAHSQPAVSVWEDNPFTNLKEAIQNAVPQHLQSDLNSASWWIVDLSFASKLESGATPLVSRCIREYGWDEKFTRRVLLGYKQFFQLKKAYADWDDELIRPSHYIKKMWILHILDTKNYGDDCLKIIGHHIHHRADEEEGVKGNEDEGTNEKEEDEKKEKDEANKLTEEEMKYFSSVEDASTFEEAKTRFGDKFDEEIWKFKVVEEEVKEEEEVKVEEPKSPKSPSRKSFASFQASFTSNPVASSKGENMATIPENSSKGENMATIPENDEEPKQTKKKLGWRLRKFLSRNRK